MIASGKTDSEHGGVQRPLQAPYGHILSAAQVAALHLAVETILAYSPPLWESAPADVRRLCASHEALRAALVAIQARTAHLSGGVGAACWAIAEQALQEHD